MRRRDEKFPDNGFEAWGGYMQAKIAKLEEQYSSGIGQNENKVSNIFSGIGIYVNGYTVPSADELKELMAKHGGVYHAYQRNDDFIIASNLPDTKVKKMNLARVVKPEWITDSIAANRLLDFKEYLLYRNSRMQQTLQFSKKCDPENVKVEQKLNKNVKNSLTELNQISKIVETNCDLLSLNQPSTSSNSSENRKTDSVTKTAADPNFISEFYNNSRLHHISQLGACFKQYVNDLREKSQFLFPAREILLQHISLLSTGKGNLFIENFQNHKIIMHIDMDCFFVSVGLRKRPDLLGKPVAVTHSKGGQSRPKRAGVDRETEFNLYKQKQAQKLCKVTGIPETEIQFETRVDKISDEDDKFGSMSEIASCSYEARAKGISNGMFMGAALRLCPDLQTIPYDFEAYKDVAYTLYNTISQYTLDIEAVSCDEMYVDCSELINTLNISVENFASALRNEIREKTGCPCSTGFGSNRLQARLATKKAKPNGQYFLTSDLVDDFMFNIKLRDLPGVGRQTAQKLEALGHQTCGSFQTLSLVCLQRHLGNKTGAQLYDQSRGCDNNPLTYQTVRKSVSAEVNYGIRFENNEQCEEFLKQLSAEVHSRMQQFKVLGKCITLKLMIRAENAPVETAKFMGHGFCDVVNKSSTLQNATNDLQIISKEVISICRKQNINPKEMRGIGIQITKLEPITSKPIKGSINKFLTSKAVTNQESKSDNVLIMESANKNVELNINDSNRKKIVTPKKNKSTISPKKKSPILNLKSPPKRRGRPPKCATVQNPKPVQNLINKFLQGHNAVDTSCEKMIQSYSNNIIKEKTIQIEEKPQGLLGLPWERVRELLRAWFDSGQTPKLCDVNLITAYMNHMVANKNIDKLYILVNFMIRRIKELDSCVWNEVQEYVIDEVQTAMVAVYGKKLWLNL